LQETPKLYLYLLVTFTYDLRCPYAVSQRETTALAAAIVYKRGRRKAALDIPHLPMDHSLLRAISLSPGQAYEDCAAHTPAHIRRHIIPDEQEKGCSMYLPTVLDMGRLRLYRMVQATRRDMETAAPRALLDPRFQTFGFTKGMGMGNREWTLP
jgi:hypothetical protein